MSIKPRKQAIMITGANGEIGNALINALHDKPNVDIVAVDLRPLEKPMRPKVRGWHIGDILDQQLMQRLVSEYEVTTIFHLAALLSTRAEFTPEIAHRVNVEGTLELLKLAHQQSSWSGRRTKFIFPSSIAVYGLSSLKKKNGMHPLREFEHTTPQTMYGCNKLYCEHLGRYFAENYQQLAAIPTGSASTSGRCAFRASSRHTPCPAGAPATMAPRCSTPPRPVSPTSPLCGQTPSSRS
jgi:nucleoside-diphosphate-sugar epimerase